MVTGFIYLRISPSGKGYIGQAVNLDSRDNDFLRVNHPYGGRSVENARKKYPPKLWRKVVLATINAKDRIDLRVWLDALEVYFIWCYKTADKHHGYNTSFVNKLEFVAMKYGTRVIHVDKWFASSKTCSGCGYVNKALRLSDRSWTCPSCGMVHDRDLNAAFNLMRSGMDAMTRLLSWR